MLLETSSFDWLLRVLGTETLARPLTRCRALIRQLQNTTPLSANPYLRGYSRNIAEMGIISRYLHDGKLLNNLRSLAFGGPPKRVPDSGIITARPAKANLLSGGSHPWRI